MTAVGTSESMRGGALPGWRLVWCDEFDGASLDRTRWEPQLGNGFTDPRAEAWVPGWGNGELQSYTDHPDNLLIKEGCLVIRALKQRTDDGCEYTSARIRTRTSAGVSLYQQAYGRFECRARMTAGQGLWPAFWMLPCDEAYGGWAASGEIDVMEVVGRSPEEVLGSIHFGGSFPARDHRTVVHRFAQGDSAQEFHVYAVEWDPGLIRWYVDDHCYAEQAFWWSSSRTQQAAGLPPRDEGDLNPWPAPFDRPFHLLLNLAVGGGLPGPPDDSTAFPAEFVVDYVRVYEREDGVPPLRRRGEGTVPFEQSASMG